MAEKKHSLENGGVPGVSEKKKERVVFDKEVLRTSIVVLYIQNFGEFPEKYLTFFKKRVQYRGHSELGFYIFFKLPLFWKSDSL